MKPLLLLVALIPAFASAECVDIVPGKSLGLLKIGQVAPADKIGPYDVIRKETSPDWPTAGPYLFHLSADRKIDQIQFDPADEANCYSLKGKRLPQYKGFKEIKKAFPRCKQQNNIGPGWALACDGVVWVSNSFDKPAKKSPYRVIVENQTLRRREEEKAGNHVKGILQGEWPYRGGQKSISR